MEGYDATQVLSTVAVDVVADLLGIDRDALCLWASMSDTLGDGVADTVAQAVSRILLATVSAEDLAQQLGFDSGTVYRWAREGRIPCVRMGTSVRFRVVTIARWMQQQEADALERVS